MKRLFLLLLIITVSCRPTKTTIEYKEVIRVDTFKIERSQKILPAVHDTLIIDNPCDSSGILSTFYSKIKIPQGQVVIRSVRGKIQATVDIDSIANVYEKKYASQNNSNVTYKYKEVTKYKIPFWAILVIAIQSIIIFGYLYIRFFIKI
jgi:hypothetical protein